MIKYIFKLIKKVLVSGFLLYGYNLVAAPLGFIIPINVVTISLLSVLGVPSLLSLILVLILVF